MDSIKQIAEKARKGLKTKLEDPKKIIYKDECTRVYDKSGSIRVSKDQ